MIKLTANPNTAATKSEHIYLDVSDILKREITVVSNEFISQVIVIHFIIFLVSCDSLSYCQVNARKNGRLFSSLETQLG